MAQYALRNSPAEKSKESKDRVLSASIRSADKGQHARRSPQGDLLSPADSMNVNAATVFLSCSRSRPQTAT
jgi:hypothetical protein